MLAVIPARGGSKGIKNKNLQILNNKPLLFWSIERSLESNKISKTIVSSDSNVILNMVKATYGPRVELHKRSKELSKDDSRTVELLQYLSKKNEAFKDIILLQPTSPLRKKGFIDQVILNHENSKKKLTLTGFYSTSYPFGEFDNLPRQKLKKRFYDDGNIYVFKSEVLKKGTWIPETWNQYENEFPFYLEIDTHSELELINDVFEKYYYNV